MMTYHFLLLTTLVCVTLIPSLYAQQVFPYNQEEKTPEFWNKQAFETIRAAEKRKPIVKQAKNAILFLGDGMGISTLTAGRIRKGQLEGKSGEESSLTFEKWDNSALIKTYNVDRQVPDSAGTATAYLTGVKANYETIGVNARVNSSETNCDHIRSNAVDSIFEIARKEGKAIGIVTTTRITHATPSAAYAHVAHRDWEYDGAIPLQTRADGCRDIAYQLINREPGNSFRVIFGGGRRNFKPKLNDTNNKGVRTDGLNLIEQWKANRAASGLAENEYAYVETREELLALKPGQNKYAFGLFDDDHINYEVKRHLTPHEPSLTEMASKAIELLSAHKQGFVLLIEGGRIDHAHHENHGVIAVEELVEFDRAITKVMTQVDTQETLVAVTADHSHTFVINGYPVRGNTIFGNTGFQELGTNKSFTTLMYANGPGNTPDRVDTRNVNTSDPDYLTHSAIKLKDSHHGGEDVAIYSQGPMAHMYYGLKEQNYIPHVFQYSLCIGFYKQESHCRPTSKDQNNASNASIGKFPYRQVDSSLSLTMTNNETSHEGNSNRVQSITLNKTLTANL